MATRGTPPRRRGTRGGSAGDGNQGEYRSSPEVRSGLIRGSTFAAKSVRYSVVDGLALFEGDIVLGTEEQMRQQTEQMRLEKSGAVAMGVAITGAQFRWPNCRIPFTIDPALPDQARVTEAIAHWEANTNYRFVPRTTETDYVTFRPGGGCSSMVGRQGGQQFVNLAPACSRGNAIHEIGHVIGLWHEQSREDRDLFVTINWANIQAGLEHNFDQHITDGDDIGAYDYGSIMHYPRNAFSANGLDTIVPVDPTANIGQRTGLSPGDIAAANSLCTPLPTFKEGPKDPIKEQIKDLIRDTIKETIKDIRLDTLKEVVRDTVKEGVFDPGPGTLVETIGQPGRPVVLPGGGLTPGLGGGFTPGLDGAVPFAAATPQPGGMATAGNAAVQGIEATIAQLDAQLQSLATQIAQTETVRLSLQAQYDETTALMQRLIAEHEAGSRG